MNIKTHISALASFFLTGLSWAAQAEVLELVAALVSILVGSFAAWNYWYSIRLKRIEIAEKLKNGTPPPALPHPPGA